MKEATGELNLTVVVIVIIALVVGVAVTFIIPALRGGLLGKTRCNSKTNCTACDATNKTQTCNYFDENGEISNSNIICDCEP